MFDTLNIVKALADENRLRLVMALRGKELCVCTLTELLDLAPSTTSKHLSILKQARLIESVKDGKFVYYRLASPGSKGQALAGPALEWVDRSLAGSRQARTDAARLRAIIRRGRRAGPEQPAASEAHQLYRHVPGIHAVGDFRERSGSHG